MPRMFRSVMIVLTLLALVPLLMLVRARVVGSGLPRLMVVYDMDNQDRYETQSENRIFADGRAMRPPPAGTAAGGEIDAESPRLTGREPGPVRDDLSDAVWLTEVPGGIGIEMLRRGRERYGIHCAPCHGMDGSGDGIVSRRAISLEEGTWVPPTDLTDDMVRERPIGNIYNTIAAGIRRMPAYGSQIAVADRWATAAYVRALQRSRRASLADAPPAERGKLEAE